VKLNVAFKIQALKNSTDSKVHVILLLLATEPSLKKPVYTLWKINSCK